MKNIFITMEGPDGAGKSTQIELLKKYFEGKDIEVVLTREPGGTRISEAVRAVILNKEYKEMDYKTELMLYTAARAQLVAEVIKPALLQGKAVICDRFVDSSAVYQGMGRGLGVEQVYKINEYALDGLKPILTILLDLDATEGIRRKKNQAELDRMEEESIDFHKKVVEGYRQLAELDKDRIYKIDATLPVEEIAKLIREEVDKRI